jgi:hypothetical protein
MSSKDVDRRRDSVGSIVIFTYVLTIKETFISSEQISGAGLINSSDLTGGISSSNVLVSADADRAATAENRCRTTTAARRPNMRK